MVEFPKFSHILALFLSGKKVIPYNGNNSRKKKFAICPALFYSREKIRECKTILLKYKYTIHSTHAIQQENVRECTRNRENREHFLSRTIPDIQYVTCWVETQLVRIFSNFFLRLLHCLEEKVYGLLEFQPYLMSSCEIIAIEDSRKSEIINFYKIYTA